jgi:hypothetical protein
MCRITLVDQVDSQGRSWRSGAQVERRPLRQWFLRTTQFSRDLYDNLDDPSLVNWRDITTIQVCLATCVPTRGNKHFSPPEELDWQMRRNEVSVST